MKCTTCGAEVSREECDPHSGVCHKCQAAAAGGKEDQTRGKSSGLLLWAGRIGHVLLCALVGAPFGVLGLFLVASLLLFTHRTLGWLLWLLDVVSFGMIVPPLPPYEQTHLPEDEGHLSGRERWQVLLASLVAIAILVACYLLGDLKGVLIGGGVLGALLGATLSILSQLPERKRPAAPAP
jgi:hypothetical protein